jgi:adenylosuccinate lyase
LSNLATISPLDGRYAKDVAALEPFFSEAGLYRYRVRVEVEYLLFLSRVRGVGFIAPLDATAAASLRALYRNFGLDDAQAIAAWDKRVNHDVKAVEYWLRERLDALGLGPYKEAVHWALTSEDVNNLAYGMLLHESRDQVLRPALGTLLEQLHDLARSEAHTAMLARTHGQAATPTTLGKELAVFAGRLQRGIDQLAALKLTGKLNGATGSFAAHVAALPYVDWLGFSRAFVRFLELEPVLLTTQIEPHDSIAELCDAFKRINTVLIDLCQDVWRYISDGYFVQQVARGEVGSSTMPHKVNPIDFENAEGNLGLANALFEFFARKLPVSRLQRDLSDSTTLRNLGVACGYSLLAYSRIARGLAKLRADHTRIAADLAAHPEVLAEAVQTILRREGFPEPYEALKAATRGRALTLEALHEFIAALDVPPAVRDELLALTPEGYIGLAAKLATLDTRSGGAVSL